MEDDDSIPCLGGCGKRLSTYGWCMGCVATRDLRLREED